MWVIPVVVVMGIYAVLLLLFMCGWKRLPEQTKQEQIPDLHKLPAITVVVACRNEAEHLPALLESLLRQTVSPAEIILVNDNSTDDTLVVMDRYAARYPAIRVLSMAGDSSKKKALAAGIRSATSELILCTDADCIVPETWVQTVVAAYVQQPFDLLILPVSMQGDSFFSRLQQLEFATLVASGAAMAAWRHPIMCNGANLAFRRQEWLASQADLHEELPSGDDMFLLHGFKRRGLRIRFLKSRKAMVYTSACPDLRSFVRQRGRWTSKAGYYTDADTIVVAVAVFTVNLLWLVLFVGAFFNVALAWSWLAVFLVKWLLDGLFLKLAQSFFAYRHVAAMSFLLSLVYPFYVLVSVLHACFGTQKKSRGNSAGFA